MRECVNYVAFGQRIRRNRKAKRMTQNELAEAAGISLSFLNFIERGARRASMETLIRIASALEVTPDELLKDSLSTEKDVLYIFPEPVDHFARIRKELDLLEMECRGTKLT